MPFITSKFSAQFALRLLPNIQTVLERDLEMALRGIDENLPLFKEWRTPIGFVSTESNFPCLFLEPADIKIKQSDDDASLFEEHQFSIMFSIIDADPIALRDNTTKYALAIDRVLRTMTADELTGTARNEFFGAAWEVTDHRYGVTLGRENQTMYRRDAQLVLTVQLMER